MPSTSYVDTAIGARAIGARTDAAGAAATDLSSSEDRIVNDVVTEGYLTDGAFEVSADSPASMDVIVGSGTSGADVYVVGGDDDGQHNYMCRLDSSGVTVTLDAADASNGRIDEVWLVVADNTYDSGGLSLPRIGYRKGDASASPAAPGADAAWKAAVLLASITVDAGVSSVDAGDITDQRATAALSPVLGDVLAKLAGATFTGAVTVPQIVQSGSAPLGTDPPSSYANGLTFFPVSSTNGWPDHGEIVTFNLSTGRSGQLLLPKRSESTTGAVRFRGLDAADSGWGDWVELAQVDNVGEWEVDNATEVVSQTLTGSYTTVASVTLDIDADWGSWKCVVDAKASGFNALASTGAFDWKVRIDGTDQQVQESVAVPSGGNFPAAIGGRRTGMSTTGSRTVSLLAQEAGGSDIQLRDLYLYARAVRTS